MRYIENHTTSFSYNALNQSPVARPLTHRERHIHSCSRDTHNYLFFFSVQSPSLIYRRVDGCRVQVVDGAKYVVVVGDQRARVQRFVPTGVAVVHLLSLGASPLYQQGPTQPQNSVPSATRQDAGVEEKKLRDNRPDHATVMRFIR